MRHLLFAVLALLPVSAGAQGLVLEAGVRRVGNVDETLSPLRYSGGTLALRVAAALHRRRIGLLADADLGIGTLTADVGSAEHPELRATTGTLYLGVETRPRRAGRVTLVPGLGVAGRIAQREHQFTGAQSSGRYPGSVQPSFDQVVALQPRLRVERAGAAGRLLSAGAALGIVGAARHPYYPQDVGGGARWRSGGPGRVLFGGAELLWRRPLSSRTMLGLRYSLRMLRLAGTSEVAEVSHQVGASIGWGGTR